MRLYDVGKDHEESMRLIRLNDVRLITRVYDITVFWPAWELIRDRNYIRLYGAATFNP